ncbi:gamma-glutamylcyclotransferase family protein [Paraburkholderia sp. BCC1876]|uniref:gamma-glutamylcyclotransferase family protein n=1 Tax=Paraburkholderia sp. BCC1876 TaxID=2676303 RepID=UPI0015926DF1|nr:gamma-glutamylcyclotransferase family protein [Paraburkholderia sp. BCC1876]
MTLTTRPDHFLYFAYGSNMCVARLTAPGRAPSAAVICSAYATGRRLTFDKASKDGSAKCDCKYTGNATDRVYGVVFEIHASDKAALDRAEGKGYGYDALDIEVTAPTGPAVVLTYIATNKTAGLRPYDWYKRHVLNGASAANLPGDYISMIAAVESVPDPDDARSAREDAIRC